MLALAALAAAATLAAAAAPAGGRRTPTLREMIGQLLLVRMHGTQPSPSFLRRVHDGEVGGIVLFNDNFQGAGPAKLIATLQAVATSGGQPPLLVAIDQEGGTVKRLPGAPSLAPPEMRTPTIAEAQGLATARNLKAARVNLDLAPVLDIGRGGFITARSFGATPAAVAGRATAFAAGLRRGGVLATAKHFPGLGYASLNTDTTVARVTATASEIKADWQPYRRAIRDGVPLVMMATAIYPALGSNWPAALSPNIVHDLRSLGFNGAIVTDALQTPAVNKFMPTAKAAVEAVYAGDDLVLAAGPTGSATDTDGASIPAYKALLKAAASGRLKRTEIVTAYERVMTLKQQIR